MNEKIIDITLYKDLWCNVFATSSGKFLMLHKNDEEHKQPNDFWEKSFKYGFEENIPGKHSLYVTSYLDYKRIKTIDSFTSKGYFELLGRRIYALEYLVKPYNIPKYFQLSEDEYKQNYTSGEISRLAVFQLRKVICDGFKNSGKNYFSLLDLSISDTSDLKFENIEKIKFQFDIFEKDDEQIPLAKFEDKKYETLSYFLTYEANKHKSYLLKELKEIMKNNSYKHKVVLTGKSCSVDITSNRVIVENAINGISIGKLCEINTNAFYAILNKWYDFVETNKLKLEGGD